MKLHLVNGVSNMVYHKYKLVFPAIPKCMTTSIHNMLRNKIDHAGEGQYHYSVMEMVDTYGNSLLSDYTSFAVVRNPYDRLWSAWKHLSLRDQYVEEDGMVDTFRDFVKTELPLQFANPKKRLDHYMPQVDYIYAMRRHCMVDKILRFENFNDEWESFRLWYRDNTLGDVELPNQVEKSNKSVTIKEDPYDEGSRAIVKKFYKDDFRLLGYDE